MNIERIMELTQKRSELLAALKDVDAQIRAEAGETPAEAEPVRRSQKSGAERLPYNTADKAVEWAAKQQTPFSAYHVCRELGLDRRFEKQVGLMLAAVHRDGRIERLTEGTRSAQAVYKRKGAQLAAVNNG